jgi:hypothetical protein
MSSLLCFGSARCVRNNSIAANGSPLESAAGANATVRPDRAALRLAGGVSTAIVGLTGFYMIYRFDMWDRFRHAAYWWIDAMVAVWLLFIAMLFVVEPSMVACAIPIKTGSILQGCRMAASNPTVCVSNLF